MVVPTGRPTLRCRAGTHRVALDPARLWAAARCPTCRTPLDPLRLGRASLWLRGAVPSSRVLLGTRLLLPLDLLAGAALAVVLAGALLLWGLGDRHWLGTVALFAGRWPWLVPALVLLPFAVLWRRRALWPLGLALGLGLFPVMGARLGWRRALSVPPDRLRVITYNVAAGQRGVPSLPEIVARWAPDVIAIQECGAGVRASLGALDGWAVDSTHVCLASRYPLLAVHRMPNEQFHGPGGAGYVATYELATPHGTVWFTNLHLETPRDGLEVLLGASLRRAIPEVHANTLLRDIESVQARRFIDSLPGPRLVAGDFNMPVESALWRRHWGDLLDAHDAAGTGFGWSKRDGWIRSRIDHVLSDGAWQPRRAMVGPDYGSDHDPLIVDFAPPR
ncbi:MAG: endonuclease/exonuclease/phosphatase family protein [Gemmatimonadales bacterium]|jgi:endonuclease/exonuclease/phosphatase (EEP) superfamily protein YafD|nr:endonuclease/exonuclease/phosphatase family protein [Gemmatimonadales bacterium]